MKLLILLTVVACLQTSARSIGQTVTLSLKDAPLEKAFKEIKKQTGYSFVYTRAQLLSTLPVTIQVRDGELKEVLGLCFRNQPLNFLIEGQYVIVQTKWEIEKTSVSIQLIDITGKVVNENGEPLAGITIQVKGTDKVTISGSQGEFEIRDIPPGIILLISGAEIENREIKINSAQTITIVVNTKVSILNETVVKGYYVTSRKLNTGSTGKISADEISKQPVGNPLAALQGRIPGLLVTQTSGIPGSSFRIQVRGKNSISQGNDPLIIIDGVPFVPNNSNINQVAGAFSFDGNGLSPLNMVNPADIERIEVLKDADATAIYGSRGANGIVFITTKKAQTADTKLDFKVYTGFSKISRRPKLLTTSEYVNMRREAFANDAVTPTNSNAFDLLLWDTSRYTDFGKELIGGTAVSTNAQVSFSGGSSNTKFLLSSGYNRETTVYPGNLSDDRVSLHFNLNHASFSRKFLINFTGIYSYDNNKNILNDLAKYINLPPNLPDLYDQNGNLNWNSGGFSFTNPMSFLRQSYSGKTETFLTNASFQYKLRSNVSVKTNIGFNSMHVDEVSTNPISAKNPASNPTGSSQFGSTNLKGLIIEPQIEAFFTLFNGKLELLLGGSWQQNNSGTSFLVGSGYTNDALLKSPSAAGSLSTSNTHGKYRYAAAFGRVSYNRMGKYLLNFTIRKDGSSRFGPGRQYAVFGAIGTGWIFSNEGFFKKMLPIINFGKLRASYGTAGNDNIGDYQYLDKYRSTSYPYQGSPGLFPSSLFNPDYSWEVNKKLEVAIELGVFSNKLMVTAGIYRNRSSNQLIQYSLPSQTGFNSIIRNFPAIVQNAGFEIDVSCSFINNEKFNWTSSINFSFPKNKLVSFPELENSSYRNLYIEGFPLNIGNGFYFAGVNPQTGIYEFIDIHGNISSAPVYPRDIVKGLVKLDPEFFGGWQNTISYKNWQLDLHAEFRKQTGISYLYNFINTPPGSRFNQPDIVLQRWKNQGDLTNIQRFTTTANNPAYQAINQINFYGAENKYTDASFIRLKNVSLAYSPKSALLHRWRIKQCQLFFRAQNLLTITDYYGGDPETQNALRLPPLKTFALGILLTF